jgi:hypothetical protein
MCVLRTDVLTLHQLRESFLVKTALFLKSTETAHRGMCVLKTDMLPLT